MNTSKETSDILIEKSRVVNKDGPVIIIEDDVDDQVFLAEIFDRLKYPNKVLFF